MTPTPEKREPPSFEEAVRAIHRRRAAVDLARAVVRFALLAGLAAVLWALLRKAP